MADYPPCMPIMIVNSTEAASSAQGPLPQDNQLPPAAQTPKPARSGTKVANAFRPSLLTSLTVITPTAGHRGCAFTTSPSVSGLWHPHASMPALHGGLVGDL